MIICDALFWQNFWPNFTSTLAGLILGLPIALLTNRLLFSWQNRKQKMEETGRLHQALTNILNTLTENHIKLLTTQHLLDQHQLPLDTSFDTSAWEVMKNDVIQFLRNPDLKAKIAYHFSRLITLNKLCEKLSNFASIDVRAAIPNKEKTIEDLRNYIVSEIGVLIKDIDTISVLITNYRSKAFE